MAYFIVAAFAFIATIIFVMGEAALASFNWVKYEKRVKKHKKNPGRWMSYLDRVGAMKLAAGFLASFFQILLVLCIVMFLAGRDNGIYNTTFFISFGAAVAFVLVLGNVIPRIIAEKNAEGLLLGFMPFFAAVAFIFRPIGAAIIFTRAILGRVAGAKEKTPEEEAEDELLSALEEGEHDGAIEEEEREMIEAVLQLGDFDVGRIMTPRTDMIAVPIDRPVLDLVPEISMAGHSRIPVYEGNRDRIRGILYVKDLVNYIEKPPEEIPPLREIMREMFVVPETKPVQELLKEFKARKVHIAVVLDEYGGTSGIVTMEDILEEIVGEIEDEYDKEPKELVKRLGKGRIEADARVPIDEINEILGIHLPEDEDYDTVGGFVTAELGRIPDNGETFVFDGAEFVVVAADERRVKTILISLRSTEEPGS
ncbi:MAG: hemolysin family protein [Planctomycetota bacterium]|jgi:putative hemolysin